MTDAKREQIYTLRMAGASIGQLAKEFGVGEATIYRALNAVKQPSVISNDESHEHNSLITS